MTEATTKETVEGFLLKKKTDNDYSERHAEKDFLICKELAVTITLREYRDLIRKVALTDIRIRKADAERYKEWTRAEAAEAKVKKLRKKLKRRDEAQRNRS